MINDWLFAGATKLEGELEYSHKLGQQAQKPKYEKRFVNTHTGEYSITTDLAIKKNRRKKHLNNFKRCYEKYLKRKEISLLGVIVNQKSYDKISKFMNTCKKKLNRKGVKTLGYVWQRDVGDEMFEHYHILLATTRINNFYEIFKNKKNNKYNIEFEPINRMKNYLAKKELFGIKKQRAYGKSREFKVPEIQKVHHSKMIDVN
jgi:hypothetical protein